MVSAITGKTVVVTGGNKGIGLGLVKKFLARENVVIATTRKSADAQQLQQLQQQFGASRLHITHMDVTAAPSIAEWAEGVKGKTQHVDIVVNNAGVYGRRPALEEFTEEDFMYAFRTNTLGPFFVVQQMLKQDLLGPPGSLIVNVSSIVGSNTDPTVSAVSKGGYAYRASKAALNIVSTTLARDLAERGVQCVALHPGYVRTDLSGGNGWIDTDTSAGGMVDVLESGKELNGRFYAFDGAEIPW